VKHQWMPAGGGGGILAALWNADPMTVALLRPGFVPNYDAQKVWADIAASELAAGGGYAAGGVVLTGKATPYNAAGDQYDLQAADVTWGPGATFDAAFAVIYDNTGSKPLWSMIDFEGTKSVVGGTFTIDFAAAGVLYVTLGP
jgi:hypothetical protein